MLQWGIPTLKLYPPSKRSPETKPTRKPFRFSISLFVTCRTIATSRHAAGNSATRNHNAAPPLRIAGLRIKRRSRGSGPVIPHWYPRSRLNRHRRVDPRSPRCEMAHSPIIAFPLLNATKYAASGQSANHPKQTERQN